MWFCTFKPVFSLQCCQPQSLVCPISPLLYPPIPIIPVHYFTMAQTPYRSRDSCPVRAITVEEDALFLRWLPSYARTRVPPIERATDTIIFFNENNMKSRFMDLHKDGSVFKEFGKLSEEKQNRFRGSVSSCHL